MELISNPEEQTAFINGVVTGVNLPDMKEEDAIAKLKELGYDTTRIEASLKSDNNVVSINE